jgi:AIPR protein
MCHEYIGGGILVDLIIQGLMQKFQKEQGLNALKEDELFEAFAGFCVLSRFYEDVFDPDQFRMGGSGDLGIDIAGLIINGELYSDAADVRDAVDQAKELRVRFVVIQAKTSSSFETKTFTDLSDNLVHLFAANQLTYPCSSYIVNIWECIRAVYFDVGKLSRNLPSLSVSYVSTGASGDSLLEAKRASAAYRLETTNLFEDVEMQAVGARDLRELYKRATDVVSAKFTMAKRITMPTIPGVTQAFVGILPARELVDRILTDSSGGIRKTLFYENVRDFQEYNPVNLEIQKTLRDADKKERFAVLNNGVTIVARELTTAADEFRIRDFQIVNGCQTCHVLFDEEKLLDAGVNVNVRLIESRDEDVIAGIIAATNRQTAVSDEDLTAREEFHKRLEDYFSVQPESRRLYYERRSKQYNDRPDIEKKRIITRPQLTRAYAAMFLGEPAGVGHYKQLVMSKKEKLFKTDHNPLVYYTAAVTYYRLEWLLKNRRVPSEFAPARYHLLAAIKQCVFDPAPAESSWRTTEAACKRLLLIMWDISNAEDLVNRLLPAFEHTITEELEAGVPLGEMVRTERFAERIRAAIRAFLEE